MNSVPATPETDLGQRAAELVRGESPADLEILKRSRLRCVARAGPLVLKALIGRPQQAARERRKLERARARGIAVPEVVASGSGEWPVLAPAGHTTIDQPGIPLQAYLWSEPQPFHDPRSEAFNEGISLFDKRENCPDRR